MRLDVRTELIVLTWLGLVLALLAIAVWRTRPTYPGYRRWVSAGLLFVLIPICFSLLSLRAAASDWIKLVIANASSLMGSILLLEGAREFRGLVPRVWLSYAGGVATIAAVVFFSYTVPNPNARAAVASTFVGIVLMLASITLLRDVRPAHKFGLRLTGGMFALCAATVIARALYCYFGPPVGDAYADPPVLYHVLFLSIAAQVSLFPIGFILMADEQVMMELSSTAKALERSNIELESLAYATTHDLQEPLRTVTLYAQLLQAHRGNGSTDYYTKTIIDGVDRMTYLIRGVLEYSRVNWEPLEPNQQVDLNEVLAEVQQNLSAQIVESSAQIAHSQLPVLTGSRVQLLRLTQNLIGNSLKFRSPKRVCQIRIQAEKQREYWVISVQDNGVGFKPEYAQYIFEMFKQLGRKLAGAGIGLATCRAIVERHGGKIWAEAEEEKGAAFHFTWPVVPVRLPQPKGSPSRETVSCCK